MAGTISLALTVGKKLKTQTHLTPATSVMIPKPPLLYKVELLIDDGENYATFLVLDKEMMKLLKQDAATLLDDAVNHGQGNKLPECIAKLQGQVFLYHVHVTPDNFTDSTRTFTVSGLTEIPNKEFFTIKAHKNIKVDYGESSTSAAVSDTSTNEADRGSSTSSNGPQDNFALETLFLSGTPPKVPLQGHPPTSMDSHCKVSIVVSIQTSI
ncbi:uncharacterized protein LOC108841705 [Raphanus sativus]|uniref:Uncharacterized protein LOC108841705 n=1 Tax=Raphanus sativus TaxID=3726 RepID=A0A9W3C710_RAPSA|nr:uncharacterized protein LOC108841705 [Raphanus sativus]